MLAVGLCRDNRPLNELLGNCIAVSTAYFFVFIFSFNFTILQFQITIFWDHLKPEIFCLSSSLPLYFVMAAIAAARLTKVITAEPGVDVSRASRIAPIAQKRSTRSLSETEVLRFETFRRYLNIFLNFRIQVRNSNWLIYLITYLALIWNKWKKAT